MYGTIWALVPPIVAILLALLVKEAYVSLFAGVLLGALFVSNFNPVATLDTIVNDGLIAAIGDNAGIFLFLVLLGVIVALVNRAGGSAAFGRWAEKNIRTRVGALLATFLLGVLIFIDDYFNCLTVGSVMRPVTDNHRISRAKLAFLIDATAAPICMIAPVSSWAAAVSGVADDLGTGISGIQLFLRAIPYNFYSLLTLVFIIALALMNFDYGPMRIAEMAAQLEGNLGAQEGGGDAEANPRGRVIDLVLPAIVLIVTCTIGMLYVGGYFGGDYADDFIGAFGNTDAFVALPWGAVISLVFTFIYFLCRRVLSFKDAAACIPQGFIAMVPPMIILTLAVSLKTMTSSLGAADFVHDMMLGAAQGLYSLLPAVIFVVRDLPRRQPPADHRHLGLPRRRGLRRPLLADLRHDDHGLGRGADGPPPARLDPAALCAERGGRELCDLYRRGLRAERADLARRRRRADRGRALRHPPLRRKGRDAGVTGARTTRIIKKEGNVFPFLFVCPRKAYPASRS